MKPKQRKRLLWLIGLSALGAIAGGAVGYWLGWRAGLAYAPPIIFGVQQERAPSTTT